MFVDAVGSSADCDLLTSVHDDELWRVVIDVDGL